ncbi:hypothetical protein GCM10011611_27910 [Aliidongia dinghuensis]|uniref:Uncharacterized protein n=1 Tax=Aliidongia dinghuensis TaxID=1867774 RepID=A0A8J3E5A4_9PROT|nr:hypothetical protein GCM10011611_27910 [Aliidongia dinghuensis]
MVSGQPTKKGKWCSVPTKEGRNRGLTQKVVMRSKYQAPAAGHAARGALRGRFPGRADPAPPPARG